MFFIDVQKGFSSKKDIKASGTEAQKGIQKKNKLNSDEEKSFDYR